MTDISITVKNIGQQVDAFLKGRLDIDRLHQNDCTGELSRKIC